MTENINNIGVMNNIAMKEITVMGYECMRCGHKWVPYKKYQSKPPESCPACHSPYWNKPRTRMMTK